VYNKKRKEASWRHWLHVVRGMDRTNVKVAEIGGRGDDVSFEQAFSNLAHAYLRDSAPKLLDHEIGFQLLDRNRENTKAVGVFAFKVGSLWLYAPVFFLNGDLKGHELLYIKNQDMFVPLKENWVTYLINRKPSILGSGIDKNLSQFGQRQPDFTQLSRSPAKFGSAGPDPRVQDALNVLAATEADVPSLEASYLTGKMSADDLAAMANEWKSYQLPELKDRTHQMGKPDVLAAVNKYNAGKTASHAPTLKEMMTAVMPALAQTATMSTKEAFEQLGQAVDFKKFIKQARLDMVEMLVKACQHAPQLAQAIDEFHGLNILKEAAQAAIARRNRENAPPKSASVLSDAPEKPKALATLRVITYDLTVQEGLPPGHTEEDQEKLLRDGVLIKDERGDDAVSIPYNIQVEKKLFNPTESGLYEILVKPNNIERCYVAVYPQGANKRENFVTVVRAGGKRDWINTRADHVFALARVEGDEWTDWFDKLPAADSVSKNGRYMAISRRGDATVPFRVLREYGESGYGGNSYEVHMEDHTKFPPKGDIGCGMYGYNDPLNYSKYRDGVRIHLNGKQGSSLRASMGDIFIPEDFKILKVELGEDDAESADDQGACGCGESADPPLMPGNLVDAQLALMQKMGSLSLYHNGTALEIHSPKKQLIEKELSEKQALVTLVQKHGLREPAARELIDLARRQRKYACYVKYADPYGSPMMIQNAPSAPADPGPVMGGESIMGTSVPTQLGIDVGMPVASMAASQTDRSVYNPNTELDERAIQQVLDAAQTGQRDVFDTAMIGTMLRAVRDDSLVDRYMGELTKGLDKLGRILFMFYWHGDRFAERYGKADMPELEDSLRNAFEMLGDVILFLKQKTIEPYPEENAQDTDLSATAGV
jgi:hypothetical protein